MAYPPAERELTPPVYSARRLRWMLNLYPPFFFQRVRVREVTRDFRRARVEVKRSPLNRNLNGSTFGGALYAAADPIYAVLLWQVFAHEGQRVEAWTKEARIEFLLPARTPVHLAYELDDAAVDRARDDLALRGTHVQSFPIEVRDEAQGLVARIRTVVYLRRIG